MRFALLAKRDSDERLLGWEEYDKAVPCAKVWSREIIAWFNDTLHPGQSSRTLVAVAVLGNGTRQHKWEKTNNVTILKRRECYDTYECTTCKITGKRHDLEEYIQVDRKFKAKKYLNCEWYFKGKS